MNGASRADMQRIISSTAPTQVSRALRGKRLNGCLAHFIHIAEPAIKWRVQKQTLRLRSRHCVFCLGWGLRFRRRLLLFRRLLLLQGRLLCGWGMLCARSICHWRPFPENFPYILGTPSVLAPDRRVVWNEVPLGGTKHCYFGILVDNKDKNLLATYPRKLIGLFHKTFWPFLECPSSDMLVYDIVVWTRTSTHFDISCAYVWGTASHGITYTWREMPDQNSINGVGLIWTQCQKRASLVV